MDMPCKCPVCGEIVELNDMVKLDGRSGYGSMVCANCAEEEEEED